MIHPGKFAQTHRFANGAFSGIVFKMYDPATVIADMDAICSNVFLAYLFADHDRRNFDPENLVAVPRSLIGVMNGGQPWHDRESLETAIGIARLKSGIASAVAGKPVCGVCGREFEPDIRTGCRNDYRQRTCRECLEKGLRAPKDYGWATCPRCGARFHRRSASQIFCSKRCCYESYRERGAVRGKR